MIRLVLAVAPWLAAPAPPGPPALAAPLFEEGRALSWWVRVEEIQYTGSAEGPDESAGQARQGCRVASVGRVGGALVSRVSCRRVEVGRTAAVEGAWLAAAKGVWYVPHRAEPLTAKEVAGVMAEPPLLATPPRAGERREGDAPEGGCTVTTAKRSVAVYGGRKAEAWCVTRECSMGDEASHTACFVEDAGPVRFESAESGGGFDINMTALLEPALPEKVVTWSAGAAPPDGVRSTVEAWVAAQNDGRPDAYAALYGPAFRGVKRTNRGKVKTYDRRRWLADRRAMIAAGQQVVLRDARVRVDADRATVTFTQLWRSPTYADRGLKELVLAREGGAWRIVREDMKTAKRWDGRL